jgi:hypothetical protein
MILKGNALKSMPNRAFSIRATSVWSCFSACKIQVAKSSKSSHYQSSRYERTPELLAFQLKQLRGQRRPINRLRCYMASFRSH